MSFVNPLGNLGHNPQPMPDMTAGIQALQRAEIQRKLQQIQQDKAWERDDRLRNEKETLEMMDIPKADFVTKTEIDKFAKGQQDYTNYITELNKQKKGKLDINDKIAIMQKKNELVSQVMKGKAFRDSFTEYQKNIIGTRSKLKDPEALAQFDAQQAALSKKMADPNYQPSPYDLIEAQQVPEPSFRITLAETAKELLPFVDSAVVDAGNGRTAVDRNKLMKVIKNKVSDKDYLFSKGAEEGKVKTIDELYNQLADYIEPSIKTNVTPWKPNEPTEKETFSGTIGSATAANVSGTTPNYSSDNAYITTQWGKPIPVNTKEGIGEFTPKQSFPNGMVQGTVKVARENVGKERPYNDVEEDQANQAGSRIEVTQTDDKGNPIKAKLITKSVIERTEEIPWSEHSQVLGKLDPNMKKYFESQGIGSKQEGKKAEIPMARKQQAPIKFSKPQEDAISKLMKLNPTMTREQIIQQITK